MIRLTKVSAIVLAVALVASLPARGDDVRELTWDDLLPGGVLIPPPVGHGPGVTDDEEWEDDTFEQAFMTPAMPVGVVEELNGVSAKIPGFIVPLEMAGEGLIKEFLLVPYFGACIHYPPPPPNQIVYVVMEEPIDVESTWAPIWAYGEMTTEFRDSGLGSAGYTLMAQKVEEYEY